MLKPHSSFRLGCLLVAWGTAAWGTARAAGEPALSAGTTRSAKRYDAAAGRNAYDWAEWSKFWAFQPVRKPTVPSPAARPWGRNEVDAFVLATLREKNLRPAPEADKLTLVRRVTYDVTGLPPTPEEIRAYLADNSDDAYETLVDRLLASPHYGERWGRHWLDVARYVPGKVAFPGVRNTAGDSHYRDYVVRAFNADKPYDRFVTEQLAGDLLPPARDRQAYLDQVIAPAFLSIGSWFDMETDPNRLRLEMVDEMVNATTKAFLGLSVACARCHDHKFDPIPAADYYALGGIFRSTQVVGELNEFWRDGRQRQLRPLAMPAEVAANDAVRRQVAALRAKRWSLLNARHAELTARWRADEARYRSAAAGVAGPFALTTEAENFDGQDNLRIAQLRKGDKATDVIETQTPTMQYVSYRVELPDGGTYRLLALHSTDDANPLSVTFNGDKVSESALAVPTGGWDLSFQRWDVVATGALNPGVNFVRLTAKGGNFPRLDRLRFVRVDPAAEERVRSAAAGRDLDARVLERFATSPADPWPMVADVENFVGDADQAELRRLAAAADGLSKSLKPYPLAVAVTDQAEPVDLPIHLRGMTYRTTEFLVPRGLPQLLDHALPRPPIPPGSSGRLELARWLTDPRHPLTARVMANRVWAWHFGRGIVDSPSDFGSRGERPTHPELLDWLAATFVEDGWSVKRLHKRILTSSTYRQSSRASTGKSAEADPAAEADPDNRLLSRFPRRRLEAEALYDAMLSTTDGIPRQPGGAKLDQGKSNQRAMYTLTNGRSPKGLGPDVRKMLALFDCPTDGQPAGGRSASATAAQSLFWLNSPLVKHFADRLADRLLKMDKLTDAKRVEMAYLLAVGRPPGKAMAGQAIEFVEACGAGGETKQEAWGKLCHALFASAEFRYVE